MVVASRVVIVYHKRMGGGTVNIFCNVADLTLVSLGGKTDEAR